MAKERDKLMDHEFDGIQEYDNPLPQWWVWLFYLTIIFAVVYFPYYHLMGGKLPHKAYEEEMNAAAEQRKALEAAAALTSATNDTAVANVTPSAEEGKPLYTANCVPCHGALGEGGIGPNLTDKFWLHGNKTEDLVKVITEGVADKGMVSWKTILGPQKIQHVVAYVQSLQGTNPPNAKPPQGQEYP